MDDRTDRRTAKGESGTAKVNAPGQVGGDHIRNTQQWGGGSKGSKGPVTSADKRNPNSSARR